MTIAVIRPGGSPVIRLGENTGEAARQASRAEASADAAASDASIALAAATSLPNVFTTKAAGLAAVGEGETFWSDEGDVVALYRDVSGAATEIARLPGADMAALIEMPSIEGSLGFGDRLAALAATSGDEGKWNTYFGLSAGMGTGLTNQSKNVGVGYGACNYYSEEEHPDTSGELFGNVGVGYLALSVMMAAFDNTAVGSQALLNLNDGDDNCAFGVKSLENLRRGANNVAVGDSALRHLAGAETVGANWSNNNIAIGFDAGRVLADGTTELNHANDCIYIGAQSRASADDVVYEAVLGQGGVGRGSNTIVLGGSNYNNAYIEAASTIILDGPAITLEGTLSTASLIDSSAVISTTSAFVGPKLADVGTTTRIDISAVDSVYSTAHVDGVHLFYGPSSSLQATIGPDGIDVEGPVHFAPGASVTPAANGDVTFELTNNTTLTVKAKGSDGTVRSNALTLA